MYYGNGRTLASGRGLDRRPAELEHGVQSGHQKMTNEQIMMEHIKYQSK